jgi:3-oxoacyl-(acyl-carrier-protein) synthase
VQHAIAITGAGVVSPVGETKEAVWQSVCSGVDLRGEWPRGDLSRYPHPSVIAVAAHDSEANFGLTGAWAKRAVDAALLQARFGQTPRRRVGCVAASTTAGVEVLEMCRNTMAPVS